MLSLRDKTNGKRHGLRSDLASMNTLPFKVGRDVEVFYVNEPGLEYTYNSASILEWRKGGSIAFVEFADFLEDDETTFLKGEVPFSFLRSVPRPHSSEFVENLQEGDRLHALYNDVWWEVTYIGPVRMKRKAGVKHIPMHKVAPLFECWGVKVVQEIMLRPHRSWNSECRYYEKHEYDDEDDENEENEDEDDEEEEDEESDEIFVIKPPTEAPSPSPPPPCASPAVSPPPFDPPKTDEGGEEGSEERGKEGGKQGDEELADVSGEKPSEDVVPTSTVGDEVSDNTLKVSDMKVAQLKEALKNEGIMDASGKKADLVNRLLSALSAPDKVAKRRPIGLASDDPHLQGLINFQGTSATAHFSSLPTKKRFLPDPDKAFKKQKIETEEFDMPCQECGAMECDIKCRGCDECAHKTCVELTSKGEFVCRSCSP